MSTPSNISIDSTFESYLKMLHKNKTNYPSLYVYGYLHCLDSYDLSTLRIKRFRVLLNRDALSTSTAMLSEWYKLTMYKQL